MPPFLEHMPEARLFPFFSNFFKEARDLAQAGQESKVEDGLQRACTFRGVHLVSVGSFPVRQGPSVFLLISCLFYGQNGRCVEIRLNYSIRVVFSNSQIDFGSVILTKCLNNGRLS